MTACIPTPPAPAPSRRRSGNTFNRWPAGSSRLPHPALVNRRPRCSDAASERLSEIIPALEHAVGAPAPPCVDLFLCTPSEALLGGALAPQLRPCDEEALIRAKPPHRRSRTP